MKHHLLSCGIDIDRKPLLIIIERRHSCPPGKWKAEGSTAALRLAFSKMKRGESFDWHENSEPYRVAKHLGIEITVRKLNGTGYRVWRRK